MDKRVISKLNEGETKMRRKRLNENKALNDREENNMSELKRKTSDDILDLVEVNDLLELDNGWEILRVLKINKENQPVCLIRTSSNIEEYTFKGYRKKHIKAIYKRQPNGDYKRYEVELYEARGNVKAVRFIMPELKTNKINESKTLKESENATINYDILIEEQPDFIFTNAFVEGEYLVLERWDKNRLTHSAVFEVFDNDIGWLLTERDFYYAKAGEYGWLDEYYQEAAEFYDTYEEYIEGEIEQLLLYQEDYLEDRGLEVLLYI